LLFSIAFLSDRGKGGRTIEPCQAWKERKRGEEEYGASVGLAVSAIPSLREKRGRIHLRRPTIRRKVEEQLFLKKKEGRARSKHEGKKELTSVVFAAVGGRKKKRFRRLALEEERGIEKNRSAILRGRREERRLCSGGRREAWRSGAEYLFWRGDQERAVCGRAILIKRRRKERGSVSLLPLCFHRRVFLRKIRRRLRGRAVLKEEKGSLFFLRRKGGPRHRGKKMKELVGLVVPRSKKGGRGSTFNLWLNTRDCRVIISTLITRDCFGYSERGKRRKEH